MDAEVGWGRVVEMVLWGGVDDLIQTNEEGYVTIEVRPGRNMDRPCSDIQQYMKLLI